MRGDLSEAEWELVEPHLPLGERGPIPNLRRHFNAVMWRFRTGSPWRDIPERYGPWSTVYGRFQIWVAAGTFQTLMDMMIAEAASRGQVDLSLVSVDSTVSRAHHHAAGMAVDPELLAELEKAAAEGKGASRKRGNALPAAAAADAADPEREERRRIRRRRKARLRAAKLGRSRGGLTTKTHLTAERRCRPLSFEVTEGQAADSPHFVPVLKGIKVRQSAGRPRTRPDAVAGDKAYSSRANRAHLRSRGIKAVIPEKADQAAHRKKKGNKGGRPVSHDTALYRDRNTVERAINKIKEWRGLATRYDKSPDSYLAGLHLRGAIIWLRSLQPTW
ncbi:IS5 family transposase [Streptomyces griseofuscus]|uniref:IS5 family transposase n=1 Tax=Streptomyces griseofuscus TaxID=146922 RepID=UPI0033D73EBC